MIARSIAGFAVLLLLCGSASAQADLEEKYQKKLEKEFMKKVPWETSLDEAMRKSRETGKPIFGYFTRSYAP